MTERHCLYILKYCLESHDFTGIEEILSDDCEYYSTAQGVRASDSCSTAATLRAITEKVLESGMTVFAHIMEIGELPEENCIYGLGKMGVLISYDEIDGYAVAFFIDMDDNGKVKRIVSSDEDYSYAIEKSRLNNMDERDEYVFSNLSKTKKDWLEFLGVWYDYGTVNKESFYRTFAPDCIAEFNNTTDYRHVTDFDTIKETLSLCMNLFFYEQAHIINQDDSQVLRYGNLLLDVAVENNQLKRLTVTPVAQ